jgi:hypothetical protein
MKELTDLEICQRIAEVEGVELMPYRQGDRTAFSAGSQTIYNPLTDDALCFSLMLRHQVSVTYGEYAVNAEILIEKKDGEHSFATQAYCPKRAICLAIIVSKEGT